MKPHIRRNYLGKFYDGKICCHNGDIAYICTSVEDQGGNLPNLLSDIPEGARV